ncbi:MurR/RpiR family transcriptional regulator [Streptomyces sp. HK10]|uniref:MurR/RpiR family transcriptional regulator n=1 Tax=Streptomyces sp. HK10 TaxID=3373255 RepID=UPI00374A4466
MAEERRALVRTLREELGRFSRAERRVARVLLTDYPEAGLTTVAALAARAGVSPPTVVRFARRFGFASYADFRSALRGELHKREAAPPKRLPARPAGDPAAGGSGRGGEAAGRETDRLLDHAGEVLSAGTRSTLTSLPPDELRAAVDLLSDRSNRLTLGGGRLTRPLAHYLALRLMQLRPGTRLLPTDGVELATLLADFGRRDVLVLFDYRRYEQDAAEVARYAGAAGARIVLFTDRRLSPIAGTADVVLSSSVEAPSPYDSMVPTLAVVETLLTQLARTAGGTARSRLARVERVSREIRPR